MINIIMIECISLMNGKIAVSASADINRSIVILYRLLIHPTMLSVLRKYKLFAAGNLFYERNVHSSGRLAQKSSSMNDSIISTRYIPGALFHCWDFWSPFLRGCWGSRAKARKSYYFIFHFISRCICWSTKAICFFAPFQDGAARQRYAVTENWSSCILCKYFLQLYWFRSSVYLEQFRESWTSIRQTE